LPLAHADVLLCLLASPIIPGSSVGLSHAFWWHDRDASGVAGDYHVHGQV